MFDSSCRRFEQELPALLRKLERNHVTGASDHRNPALRQSFGDRRLHECCPARMPSGRCRIGGDDVNCHRETRQGPEGGGIEHGRIGGDFRFRCAAQRIVAFAGRHQRGSAVRREHVGAEIAVWRPLHERFEVCFGARPLAPPPLGHRNQALGLADGDLVFGYVRRPLPTARSAEPRRAEGRRRRKRNGRRSTAARCRSPRRPGRLPRRGPPHSGRCGGCVTVAATARPTRRGRGRRRRKPGSVP